MKFGLIVKITFAAAMVLTLAPVCLAGKKIIGSNKPPTPTPLEQYVDEAHRRALTAPSSPGSLWSATSRFNDLAADPRAARRDDIVTIIVSERTSAVVDGATKTARASSTKNSITAAAGITKAAGPWANLLGASGNTSLDGSGTTSRDTTLTTTVSARVIDVLPNGNMVVEAAKALTINSENQVVTVRGVVRPADLASDNSVPSDRLAALDIRVNGKGVVNDSVRRPNFLYRLLLGLMPF